MDAPVIIVVGAGPGVSGSVARLYATHDYRVGLLGVDEGVLEDVATGISADRDLVRWAVADVTDVDAAMAAITELAQAFGRVDVLHFNPSAYREATPLDLGVDQLLEDVALGVGAFLTSVQAARPFMQRGARITATGSVAADRPSHRAASLGVQKAGLRNLVRSLDATLAPDGIRAVSVTVDGVLNRDDVSSPFHPDRVAEAIVAAAGQDEGDWRSEVTYRG